MQNYMRSLMAVPFALILFAAAAAAQQAPVKPPVGKWSGNVTPPGQGTMPVVLTVSEDSTGTVMTISLGEHGTWPASSINFAGNTFEFVFAPGPVVTCVLMKADDGSYGGNCVDEGGAAAKLVVMPPRKET
jgi:hypothetical protein